MPPAPPNPGPVSLADRNQFIDVLRGIALFGILAANMRAFAAPIEAYGNIQVLFPGHADVIAQAIIDTFFQGKFISIFSFLFGMGFAMQMSRAEARGARFLGFYPRRLLALALFGLIHGILIWAGDILLTYALAGAILLLFRNCRQKTLLYWAAGLFSLPIIAGTTITTLYFSGFRRHWMEPKPVDLAALHKIINIYAHGTPQQIIVQNFIGWKNELPTQAFAIYAVALFLLGMWTWRQNIVQRLDEYRPILKAVCAWCLPTGFLLSLYVAVILATTSPTSVSLWRAAAGMLWLPGAHILAAGYISGLALIFLNRRLRRLVMPFAAVGRMALTDYLMQSVVCTLLYDHTTTGLYGQVGPALAFVPTIVLFAAQVAFSNWWLQRYRFGPMEWLWRGMTYGKFSAMRDISMVAEGSASF